MITQDEQAKLSHILQTIDKNAKKLSDWELSFCSDIEERFHEYKLRLKITEKQWATLEKIYEKVTDI